MQNNVGVITEQGFVAGQGLGFNPVNLNEHKKDDNSKNEQAE